MAAAKPIGGARRLAAAAALLLAGGLAAAQPADGWEDDWEDGWEDAWEEEPEGLVWSGFLEAAYGAWFHGDVQGTGQSLAELRGRAETRWEGDVFTLSFKGDGGYDHALREADWRLRDLSLQFSAGDAVDFKLGRQVLTWGTGDLVFLNDLFPKDYESFFAGRDDEYLKAPSNSLRATVYHRVINWDLVWTPRFAPDIFLDGERFSFYVPPLDEIVAPPPIDAKKPGGSLEDGELALRLFRRVGAAEIAFYGYRGFFKQPGATDDAGRPSYARMNSLGASFRRPLAGGLLNLEASHYRSVEDPSGRDPDVPNSQSRWLMGFERELVANLTGGIQWYGEYLHDYDALQASAPRPDILPDRWLHTITLRLNYRMMQDKLTLDLFTFYSPSARDYHLRPVLNYRASDAWRITFGANLFGGSEPHTLFGQMRESENVYFRLRCYY